MEDIIDNVLNFLLMFGLATLVLLAVGFWLFYALKKAATDEDKRNAGEDQN